MEPFSLALMGVGLGMQVFGGLESAKNAKQQAAVSQDIARKEQGINDVKQRQMELEGRRMQMENIRNSQRARAMAESAAVNQGAQFGSGLQGGLAQIQDQTLYNMFGVNQALVAGREINQFNQGISGDKQKLAALGGEQATNQAISSLGGSLMKAGPIVGQFSQGFGNFFNTGNYSGTPGAKNTGGLY
jgi:hypothetical protein